MPRVECPKCAEWVNVTADDFGRMVNCGSCGAVFPVVEIPESLESYRQRDREDEAKELLRGPAKALEKLGIISIVTSCVLGAGYFILGTSQFRILRGNNSNASTLMLLGIVTALVGSLYSLLVLIGAGRMKDPRQRGWPIVSATLATAAILLCWPIPILNLVLCRYGIIALRRLFHPAVVKLNSFEARPLHSENDDEDPPEDRDVHLEPRAGEPIPTFGFFRDDYSPDDPGERDRVMEAARDRVRVPGMGLMVTGIIGIAITMLLALRSLVGMMGGFGFAAEEFFIHFGIAVAVGFMFFLMAAGGWALRKLKNRPLAITAASMGIFSLAICGVWLVISIPGVIFGTWAFTALSSREVKHAMRWKRLERSDRN